MTLTERAHGGNVNVMQSQQVHGRRLRHWLTLATLTATTLAATGLHAGHRLPVAAPALDPAIVGLLAPAAPPATAPAAAVIATRAINADRDDPTGLPLPTTTTPVAPTVAPTAAEIAVQAAVAQVGKPYEYGAEGPDTFDCSGLIQWAWAEAGVPLPRESAQQWRRLHHVNLRDLQPGDLVFFNGAGHVGLYVGDGQFVHAPRTGTEVTIDPLDGRRILGAARPEPDAT